MLLSSLDAIVFGEAWEIANAPASATASDSLGQSALAAMANILPWQAGQQGMPQMPGALAEPDDLFDTVKQCPLKPDKQPTGLCGLLVQVTVKSRLKGPDDEHFIIPGVKVSIYRDEAPVQSGEGHAINNNGEYKKTVIPSAAKGTAQTTCTMETWPEMLIIEAVYTNPDVGLKKEMARLYIEDLKGTPVATRADNTIPLIQDERTNDYDYNEVVILTANKKATRAMRANAADEEVIAGSTVTNAYIRAGTDVVSCLTGFTRDASGDLVLDVTMYMATFSLNVPYESQTKADENLCVVNGDYIYEFSPELTGMKAKSAKKFSGNIVCAPTSLEMLYAYHNLVVTHDDVLRSMGLEEAAQEVRDAESLLSTIAHDQDSQGFLSAQQSIAKARDRMDFLNNLPQITNQRTRIMVVCSNLWSDAPDGRRNTFNSNPAWQEWGAWQDTTNTLLAWHQETHRAKRQDTTEIVFHRKNLVPINYSYISVFLREGHPVISSIRGGHVLVVSGVVVNRKCHAVRVICQDPQGTLSGPDADGDWYSGLNKKNDTGNPARGRHVYYRGKERATKCRGSEIFDFSPGGAVTVNEIFTRQAIKEKLHPGR